MRCELVAIARTTPTGTGTNLAYDGCVKLRRGWRRCCLCLRRTHASKQGATGRSCPVLAVHTLCTYRWARRRRQSPALCSAFSRQRRSVVLVQSQSQFSRRILSLQIALVRCWLRRLARSSRCSLVLSAQCSVLVLSAQCSPLWSVQCAIRGRLRRGRDRPWGGPKPGTANWSVPIEQGADCPGAVEPLRGASYAVCNWCIWCSWCRSW